MFKASGLDVYDMKEIDICFLFVSSNTIFRLLAALLYLFCFSPLTKQSKATLANSSRTAYRKRALYHTSMSAYIQT